MIIIAVIGRVGRGRHELQARVSERVTTPLYKGVLL